MSDKKSQSSFIPGNRGSYGLSSQRKKKVLDTALITGITLFLIALLVWIGVLIYQQYLENEVDIKDQTLTREIQNLDRNVVDQLVEANRQFSSAVGLLNRHIAPSIIFEILEDITVQGLRYTSFSYEGSPTDNALITLKGEAHNFSTVITQDSLFEESNLISSHSFFNVDRTVSNEGVGTVVFDLEIEIPMNIFRYSEVHEDEISDILNNNVSDEEEQSATSSTSTETLEE